MKKEEAVKKLIDMLSDSILKTLTKAVSEEMDGPVPDDFLFAVLLAAAAKSKGWNKKLAKGV